MVDECCRLTAGTAARSVCRSSEDVVVQPEFPLGQRDTAGFDLCRKNDLLVLINGIQPRPFHVAARRNSGQDNRIERTVRWSCDLPTTPHVLQVEVQDLLCRSDSEAPTPQCVPVSCRREVCQIANDCHVFRLPDWPKIFRQQPFQGRPKTRSECQPRLFRCPLGVEAAPLRRRHHRHRKHLSQDEGSLVRVHRIREKRREAGALQASEMLGREIVVAIMDVRDVNPS